MFSRAAHPSPSSLSLQYLKVVVVVVFPIKTMLTPCRLEAELFLFGSLWSPERSEVCPTAFKGRLKSQCIHTTHFHTSWRALFLSYSIDLCFAEMGPSYGCGVTCSGEKGKRRIRANLTNMYVAAGRRGVTSHFAQAGCSHDPSAQCSI